ncbi:MAG: hypothetical protein E6J01_08510 [Chloroflexi bacterium]|nr:MAG: hypothetical protein E6J01_08510 [Chloroflexota bacterium]
MRSGLVTPKGVRRTDVIVEGRRIPSVARGAGHDAAIIDARGCYVLPGGIDPHTHLLTGISSATKVGRVRGHYHGVLFHQPETRGVRGGRRHPRSRSARGALDDRRRPPRRDP